MAKTRAGRRPELTGPQKETLEAIARMREKNGMTPTLRDLVALLGVTRTAIRGRLAALARKGYIVLVPRVARGIVLIEK